MATVGPDPGVPGDRACDCGVGGGGTPRADEACRAGWCRLPGRWSDTGLGRAADDVPGAPAGGSHVDTTEPTADERRLVESYQGILTDVARCAQAIRDGDWAQVAVIAMDLSRSGVLLAVAAGELREPTTTPRAEVVLDVVARHPGSPLTRMLHPTQPISVAKTVMTDPFSHPGA